jgi:hypothetical protein
MGKKSFWRGMLDGRDEAFLQRCPPGHPRRMAAAKALAARKAGDPPSREDLQRLERKLDELLAKRRL